MKLNIFKTTLIASAIAVSGAVFTASAAERLHVNVPFSFMVGNTKMAAGDYNITQAENGMVTLSGTKTSAMVLTVPAEAKGDNAGLSFTSTESNPVLSSIQVSGSVAREIPLHNGTDRKVVLASAR